MRGADLLIPISTDDQQVSAPGIEQQGLQQPQRPLIRPLQIVEKQHQRMLGRRKQSQEALKHQVEAVLGLAGTQRWYSGLLPDNQGQLGNQVGKQDAAIA